MVSAWSIGLAKRGNLNGSQFVPGPGAYTVEKKQKVIPPNWKFGTSNRSGFRATQNPGPGSYLISSKNIGAKFSIGREQRAEKSTFVPGPGTYNPNKSSCQSPPQYSMGMKYNHLDGRFQPGPGAYNHKSTVLGVPSMKFPKSQRGTLNQSTNNLGPGPGNYTNVRPQSASPLYGFGTSQRNGLYQSKYTPGPGQYELKSAIDLNKGVTMISRRGNIAQNEAAKVPGPGTYNPQNKNKLKQPAFKIGTQTRDSIDQQFGKTPGPGAYSPRIEANRISSPHYGLGTDTRKPLNQCQENPGPGSYEVRPKTAEGPKLSFKGVQGIDAIEREKQKVPGPGSYQPTDYFVKERPGSAKIGTSLRPQLYQSKDSPGPGYYNFKGLPYGPKWGFGSGQRDLQRGNDEPGPGSYNIPNTVGDVPKFMMNSNPRSYMP
ncbi:hypothetical protein IMG5_102570 [Ichthyophthirius multifiliis]|uniref:Uncharacterized protein n=1 Tax=Ichthyophthirius multifiliis TaxID=5932 RepID=G0QSP1_ICHMU|nr:hypothetical protein IMG5_102570 [Ichthyophthirius multifiliis]EGR31757.1 hypothetical protein IMG5_102570 [Ichthyophthirius multifiliis]|eukprot:XP_004035243.1 hypothetical protein IMG5_102570 [Ichthyophthirius multifiliis]